MSKLLPTLEEVDKTFTVDAKNGKVFWKIKSRYGIEIGDEAGCASGIGYHTIRFNHSLLYRHRLIWFYVNKKWPRSIDHINRIKGDDRIDNLRACSQSYNMANRLAQKDNTTGYKGITYIKNGRNKWCATIVKSGTKYNLGCFPTKEAAALIYNVAARHLFGEFAYLNDVKL